MSDYSYVAERAKKAFASVAKLEALVQREPDNQAAFINLKGMQKLARQASEELEYLASLNNIEICRYRIVPMEGQSYQLGHVSRSLLEYQNLFSQLYDSFRNGPKSRAILGQEAADESALEFAYTYSGSLGVVLLAQNERDFFEGRLDSSIEAIYTIMNLNGADVIREIADKRGRAVVKRIHDWSQAHVNGGFSADIKWKHSDGRQLGQMIDRSQLEEIKELINSVADEKTETKIVNGMLVGGDLENRSFHITVPNGETYRGYFDENFIKPEKMTIGSLYEAKICIMDTYYYATDQHKVTYNLQNLSGPLAEN